MAPTKSNEARGGNRQGVSRSDNAAYRRREHLSDRSGAIDLQSNDQECVGSNRQTSAADITCKVDCDRRPKSYRDKGGGRSGARRKVHNNNRTTIHGSVEAAKRDRVYSECSDEHCPVCLNRMQIYAVGICNHPVCSECSTRMRILCAQNECPICRQDMPKVK